MEAPTIPLVMATHETPTMYMPVVPLPTPAPSPEPSTPPPLQSINVLSSPSYYHQPCDFSLLSPQHRRQFLSSIIAQCAPNELAFIYSTVANLLRRDFLRDLPPELAVYVLGFIDDPRTLCRAACVSKYWSQLVEDEWPWRSLCQSHGFELPTAGYKRHFRMEYITLSNWRTNGTLLRAHRVPLISIMNPPPTVDNLLNLTGSPPPPRDPSTSSAIPTSLALDNDWVVVGLANSRIHVFNAKTGVLGRTLVGHSNGVWAVSLVKGSGEFTPACAEDEVRRDIDATDSATDEPSNRLHKSLRRALGLDSPSQYDPENAEYPGLPSDPAGSSLGWGQPSSLIVSGGCDKELRVWDVKSGYCIYVLRGHVSTIRCLKVLHRRPIAVSGSRDCTVRVWDVQRGKLLRVLEGHDSSVRSLDVCGNRVVSASYDTTCRLWDVDTGECLHVLRGHYHQVYSVAFDGVRIASGGMDTTVRVWDAETGVCLALLQGHTALVTLLQLTPTVLVTGGSDGRVITFSLTHRTSSPVPDSDAASLVPPSTSQPSFSVIQKLAAHDSTVTSLQLDDRFLVTAGNDGRVRLFSFDQASGKCEYVRELSEPSESVWKVGFVRGCCAVMCKRAGKTVMELWRFRPKGY
ncbi:WD40 repeat-like protein [Cristinia sonorae]|uniref:WD40 repeat-like protein n=1 Tax=Cristinia sonorae TaxID=1940300 RepID=A0A8K0XLG1_9AGAR|nr:WD40 repeat-like protein [Cristinia sonorae]